MGVYGMLILLFFNSNNIKKKLFEKTKHFPFKLLQFLCGTNIYIYIYIYIIFHEIRKKKFT